MVLRQFVIDSNGFKHNTKTFFGDILTIPPLDAIEPAIVLRINVAIETSFCSWDNENFNAHAHACQEIVDVFCLMFINFTVATDSLRCAYRFSYIKTRAQGSICYNASLSLWIYF